MVCWAFDIYYKGKTMYKGWREGSPRLFRMNLNDSRGNRLTPGVDSSEYDASKGNLFQALHGSANSLYECKNKGQLIKYYHAALCSHPKRTLVAAAKAGCLKEFPGLNADTINCHIGTGTFTEMGHMRQLPSGTCSETKTLKRGQPSHTLHLLECNTSSDNAIKVPKQEADNKKTLRVYMMVKLAYDWIASD
jgi:hypothetical protein